MRPVPNAICVGGPHDGMLTRIDQDVGVVEVFAFEADGSTRGAPYRVTAGRVHHPSCAAPFVVLSWVEPAHGES
jgi:hypothetical protein